MDKPLLFNMNVGDLFKQNRFAKKKKKRRWSHAPRNDEWRQSRGIPSDIGPELLSYRRKQQAAFLKAKEPNPPRWLQRQRRLEAKAKLRKAQADHDAKLNEALNPKPLLVPAA